MFRPHKNIGVPNYEKLRTLPIYVFHDKFEYKDGKLYSRKTGKIADSMSSTSGYRFLKVSYQGVIYHMSTHVAIYVMHNEWPQFDNLVVHHVNHDFHDNRLENLQLVTYKQNLRLRSGKRRNLKTGVFQAPCGRYRVRIWIHKNGEKKSYSYSWFDTEDDAYSFFLSKKAELHAAKHLV